MSGWGAMRVERYEEGGHRAAWEDFVSGRARNGHFMHRRRYLDYHADRFEDCSLLLFGDKAAPLAVLPAHRSGESLVSHGGLSFGGLLVSPSFRLRHWAEAFLRIGEYLRAEGLEQLEYRPTPSWYHRAPGEEDLFLIEGAGHPPQSIAATATCMISSDSPANATRRNEARAALRGGTSVAREDGALREALALIAETLRRRHDASPVHSADELEGLREAFPDEIRCYTARDSSARLLAAKVLFCSPQAVKLQYSGYREGSAASSAIYAHLFALEEFRGRCFDFGTSMTDTGLDSGLFAYKESLGGRLATVRRYTLPADSAPLK